MIFKFGTSIMIAATHNRTIITKQHINMLATVPSASCTTRSKSHTYGRPKIKSPFPSSLVVLKHRSLLASLQTRIKHSLQLSKPVRRPLLCTKPENALLPSLPRLYPFIQERRKKNEREDSLDANEPYEFTFYNSGRRDLSVARINNKCNDTPLSMA
eukprot:TRINITY_DN8979_c0_g1_i1.p1 TRINITY_DN8979_c0_g1~~TRINITY_DN8979_c0_g1_i1.p1  ORF type:complete len:157 (-),score=10.25 TRINITY_DN8979_c0_g1_i1:134-604(-)